MKKMILSLLAVAATMSAMAITYNAKATIILTSPNNKTSQLIIAASDDLAAGLNNGYYAELNTEGRDAALYVEYNGVKYMQFATKSLDEMVLGTWFSNNAQDGDYTLTVSNVTGTEPLKIKIGNEIIELTAGTSKTLSRSALAAAGNMVNPAPAVPGICHQNGRLEFTAYTGASVQVVGYDDNTVVAVPATDITLDYQEIDLAKVADGQYLVIVTKADQTEEKLVIKK
jgi:hypothetical protein